MIDPVDLYEKTLMMVDANSNINELINQYLSELTYLDPSLDRDDIFNN